MNIPSFILHTISGGMDSVVGLYDLQAQGCKIHAVSFDYKQRHVQEILWARHHCGRLGVLHTTIEIPQLKGSQLTDGTGNAIVPCRNPILLSLSVNLAVTIGAEIVTIGCNADDAEMFPDCRPGFIKSFNEMLKACEINVEVCAPYIHRRKWWVAGLGRELGVNFNETWSCYRGGKEPCGVCEACKKREEALR